MTQADLVFPLGDPRAGLVALADEAPLGEAVEGVLHGRLGQAHHRLAAGQLVAAGHQGIEGQGVDVRRDEGFFDEHGEDADFKVVEVEGRVLGGCGRVGHGRFGRRRWVEG